MNEAIEPGTELPDLDEGVLDVQLEKQTRLKLYQQGFLLIHPERWRRAVEEIRFEDVVRCFVMVEGEFISCPFHGRDRTPSFKLYRGENNGYCFGCPPGQGYYDSIIFVQRELDCSKRRALTWIERQFKLPPIADARPDEYLDGIEGDQVNLTFADLKRPYIEYAAKHIAEERDLDLARDYLRILFTSWPSRQEQESDPEAGDRLALASVLGHDIVERLLRTKLQGS